MEVMQKKGLKQTEVGMIPVDWTLECIKDFASITTGGSDTQDRVDDGAYPFYVRSNTIERINKYSFDGEAILTSGDGVGVGKIFHYVNGKFDFHQRVYSIYNYRKNVSGKYLFFQFSTNFYNKVMSMTAKSSVDSVRREMIADMKIPLPPTLAEQAAIATALSDVDDLIANLDQLITKKKAMKQGAMQQLLTGKTRVKGFEGSGAFKQTEVGLIPVEWDLVPFDTIFSFYSTSNFSKAQMSEVDEVGCIHYGLIHAITNTKYNLKDGVKYYVTAEQAKSEFVRDGDVIMVDASEDLEGVNKSVEVLGVGDNKFISGLHTYLLRDKKSLLADNFRGILLNSQSVKNQMLQLAVGMKVFGVSKTQLVKIKLSIPPTIDEQKAIAQTLSDMDAEIEQLETKKAKYQGVKQGMMQELLTGKTRLI